MQKTILAVDDSPTMRRMVEFVLEQDGYDVVEAVDGEDALEKALACRADLVLTDQDMPRRDGLSLIRSLRALPHYRSVPILMLTAETSAAMRARGRAVGATGWLLKPLDPKRLLDVVRRVIQ